MSVLGSFAQTYDKEFGFLKAGIQAYGATAGFTPYWMRNNQYGKIPLENSGTVLDIWAGVEYDEKKKYDWKYELELTGNLGKVNDIWLTQAYVSGRRGKWEIYAGRRREVVGLGDTSLTSGFYSWSGNAVPIPKIQFGTYDFLDFAKGNLGVFMTYAHGWWDNQGVTRGGFLHQKQLYGRIGKREGLINLFGGVNHQVIWGGDNYQDGVFNFPYGKGLNTYYYVVTLSKKRDNLSIDPNAPATESGYQFGSHLGSIDFMLTLNPSWGKFRFYRQFAWETGRIFNLTLINDGLSGISFENKQGEWVKHITWEYLYTYNQGYFDSGISKLLGLRDTHEGERESYFNNTNGGWQYWGRGIGTPLMVFDRESGLREDYFFSKNAVKVMFLGISGRIPNFSIDYQLMVSNGRYFVPSPMFSYDEPSNPSKQFAVGIGLSRDLGSGLRAQMGIGLDSGEHIKNTAGMSLGLRYQFW